MKKRLFLVLKILTMCSLLILIVTAAAVKPIAKFEFQKGDYQQGEPIKVIDQSYSPTKQIIVKREWMIVLDGKKKVATSAQNLLKNVKPGQYEVFLRVKDQAGTVSDWTSRKVVIKEKKGIEIASFGVEKGRYAMGEKISFIYTYQNDDELKIKSQKWSYKNISANGSKILGKPRYFSKEGRYEVTFQVEDEWGRWSQPKTCIVEVGTEVIERDGYYLFKKGKQGDLLEGYIDKDYNTFNKVANVTIEDKKGRLIVSNSPERINSSGILYKDQFEGESRVLLHHQNATDVQKKLLLLITSNENRDISVQAKNEALKGPSMDILGSGQAALRDYFKGSSGKKYQLKPGQTICIYDSSKVKPWKNEQVISGMLDVISEGNITLTVAALDYDAPLSSVEKLNPLSKDQHIRGTFEVTERYYYIDASDINEPTKLTIGQGPEEWVTGKDALTGEVVKNKGNYGVTCYVTLQNQKDMGIILNARGGAFQGAILWGKNKVFNIPLEEILSNKKIAALVGMVKENEANQFAYMLPNGSAAPVLFGFIPEQYWK